MSKKLYLGNTAGIICPVDGSPGGLSRGSPSTGVDFLFSSTFMEMHHSGTSQRQYSAARLQVLLLEVQPLEVLVGLGTCCGLADAEISLIVRRNLTTVTVIGALL